MNIRFRKGISETLDILNHMEKEETDKIPNKFIKYLEENKLEDYTPEFDHSLELSQMNLSEETKDILAVIYMNYWCDAEEKKDYAEILKENENKYQEELKVKYNPDKIFDKTTMQQETQNEENVGIVEYKKMNFFKRIFNRIKKIKRIPN